LKDANEWGSNDIPFYVGGIVSTYWRKGLGNELSTYFTIKKPEIMVYYRGYKLYMDWPVWTKLVDINVEPKDVAVDMTPRDNDFRVMMNDQTFADTVIKVTANFLAADGTTANTAVLTYKSNLLDNGNYWDDPDTMVAQGLGETEAANVTKPVLSTVTGREWVSGLNYTMNFGKVGWKTDIGGDPWPTSVIGKTAPDASWGVAYTPANNNKTKAVTIYYSTPEDYDGSWPQWDYQYADHKNYARGYGSFYNGNDAVPAAKIKSAKVNVTWTNVRSYNKDND